MANTSNIGFAIIAGFVVFITVRGELPKYLCVIGLGTGCATPPNQPILANSGSGSTPATGAVSSTNTGSFFGSSGNTPSLNGNSCPAGSLPDTYGNCIVAGSFPGIPSGGYSPGGSADPSGSSSSTINYGPIVDDPVYYPFEGDE